MEFEFFPWGNAYFNTSLCGQQAYDKDKSMYCWIKECGGASAPSECFNKTASPILCQHGSNECLANRIEGCVGGLASSVHDSVNYTICFEGSFEDSWMSDSSAVLDAAERCLGETVSYINPVMFASCIEGAQGETFDIANAKATAQYGASRLGTPWVVVDGKALQDVSDLLSTVCQSYQGIKPAGCT
mmetsp:Transcript_10868/g.15062  ORF Transcript_10868/g.15062 Transcript_10868/m.15062 type:complete len:187 (+) Transcript_10868:214-774(+)|eukprot:CAMPEP_0185265694 /NCGR_PEP_ID=MMETSP1359-20130426/28511_1 /TAXON_ID=552665 /ORGANISM="Bigelowiella longifila, Strain CCMP242" /LENGTH=186 /DNA_ID=CAMNT_0027855139 /DNA_START=197 /DNA_END=757 /DNA_ORIENTATION=+